MFLNLKRQEDAVSVIKLRESYNTGIEQFDEEHHKLVNLINSMFVVIRDNAERQEVEKLLAEVVSHTPSITLITRKP